MHENENSDTYPLESEENHGNTMKFARSEEKISCFKKCVISAIFVFVLIFMCATFSLSCRIALNLPPEAFILLFLPVHLITCGFFIFILTKLLDCYFL